jgi:hypothetical protein
LCRKYRALDFRKLSPLLFCNSFLLRFLFSKAILGEFELRPQLFALRKSANCFFQAYNGLIRLLGIE